MLKNFIFIGSFLSCLIAQSQTEVPSILFFDTTECDNFKVLERINNRIIQLDLKNDTLDITIAVVDNCALKDFGKMKISNDTLTLSNHSNSDELADCNCYFESNYKIYPIKSIPNLFYKDKELVQSDLIYLPSEYKNGRLIFDDNAFHFTWDFFDSGKVKTVIINRTSFREIIDFFENGNIKSNRQMFMDFDLQIIKVWDKNGNLIEYKNTVIDDYYKLKINMHNTSN